ncbi:hypothetical protein M9X92_011048, partial [Pyricularia oryzae]
MAAILLLLVAAVLLVPRIRSKSRFPPGPPTLPFLGNLHQMPTSKAFLSYQEWSTTHAASSSGLLGFHLGPSAKLLVLHKWEQVRDLLDLRGAIYSDRPYVPALDYALPPPHDQHAAFYALRAQVEEAAAHDRRVPARPQRAARPGPAGRGHADGLGPAPPRPRLPRLHAALLGRRHPGLRLRRARQGRRPRQLEPPLLRRQRALRRLLGEVD